jgi:hypothetical protein
MKIFSKNTWGVNVNNAWPLTFKNRVTSLDFTLLVIGTDFTGSYKSNYHMITTTTAFL